jgi:hypothetical protein
MLSQATNAEEAEREIAEIQAHETAATHRQLTLIRFLDGDGHWQRMGGTSCAHWLAWRLDIDLGAAREKVRVARALGTLPLIDDALRQARVSYSKVRAMSRVATPGNEADLLTMARHSTAAQLEKICRSLRRVDQEDAEREPERYVRVRDRGDGTVRLEAVLAPDEAVKIMEALRSVRAAMSEGTDLCDALVHLAQGARAEAGEKTRTGERADIVVHLAPGTIEGERTTTLDDGTHVSAETFRRLACDAGIITVREDERGDVLDVGRKTRTIPPAIQRALHVRFGSTCCFPSCTNDRFIEAHHVKSWLDGGETKLENLCLVCTFHHRFLHEAGWRVEMDDGVPRFIGPSGVLPNVPANAAAPAEPLAEHQHLHRALHIDEDTCLSQWDGSTPDYNASVEHLIRAEDALSIGEWLALHPDAR